MNLSYPHLSKPTRFVLFVGFLAVAASACGSDDVAFDGAPVGSVSIIEEADVGFTEISPFATFGSAQGNFGEGAHGTFGIFGAGEASPPHTHGGEYYAVVIEGEMNNPFGTETDPPALAPGSFWSVPANDEHVTACLTPESECRFFFHANSAFDFVQIDAATQDRSSAAASVPAADLDFESLSPFAAAATVWGDPDSGPYGSIVRLDAGDDTGELAQRNQFTLVPMTGDLSITSRDTTDDVAIGALLEAEPNLVHSLSCSSGEACTFYVFSDSPREINAS